LGGLYGFVRNHLAVVNGIIMASTTAVGMLDFLAPRVSIFPTAIYSITAALVLLMVAAAVVPRFVGRAVARLGLTITRSNPTPLWRSPVWQFAVTILLCVTIVGFASVAKASQGGLIASQFPAARGLQETLLSLQRDNAEIKYGMEKANVKLDVLVGGSQNPQKDLVARGYAYNGSGLMTAIQQADKSAIGLFVKAGFKANSDRPMISLMRGNHPWDSEIAAALPAEMFRGKYDCQVNLEGLEPPVEERLATYKRLCDTKWALEIYGDDIKRLNDPSVYPVAQRGSSWNKRMAEETFIVAQLKR
jgi:hypothetical protein